MDKSNATTGSSPAAPPPSLKKSTSASSQTSKGQKSILGFFQKRTSDGSSLPPSGGNSKENGSSPLVHGGATMRLSKRTATKRDSGPILTPVPSSDAAEASSPWGDVEYENNQDGGKNGLPSPITPLNGVVEGNGFQGGVTKLLNFSSPSRKVVFSRHTTYLAWSNEGCSPGEADCELCGVWRRG